MSHNSLINYIQNRICFKIYCKAREAERNLGKTSFIAYYHAGVVIRSFMHSIIFAAFAALLFIANEPNAYIASVVIAVMSVINLVLAIHYLTYRCCVTKEGISVGHFGRTSQKMKWCDVADYYVEMNSTYQKQKYEKTISLKNKNNAVLFRCTYALIGLKPILHRAKKWQKQNEV